MLTDAEEATDPDDDLVDLALLVGDQLVDTAELLVGVVIDVDTDQL
jgi:hypothetical protein